MNTITNVIVDEFIHINIEEEDDNLTATIYDKRLEWKPEDEIANFVCDLIDWSGSGIIISMSTIENKAQHLVKKENILSMLNRYKVEYELQRIEEPEYISC